MFTSFLVFVDVEFNQASTFSHDVHVQLQNQTHLLLGHHFIKFKQPWEISVQNTEMRLASPLPYSQRPKEPRHSWGGATTSSVYMKHVKYPEGTSSPPRKVEPQRGERTSFRRKVDLWAEFHETLQPELIRGSGKLASVRGFAEMTQCCWQWNGRLAVEKTRWGAKDDINKISACNQTC